MLRVGLTGGIACGKSNALRCFRSLGAQTMDADLIAREVVEREKPAYIEIVKEFGSEILNSDKTIDRKALGRIVFSDPEARGKLNRIVHPHVLAEEGRRIQSLESEQDSSGSPVVVVDASLMVETGSYKKYELVVVVYCPPAVQLRRLMRRDEITETEAQQRIDSQMPTLEKLHYGDYVIETSGTLSDTFLQVKQVYAELLAHFEASGSG